MNTALGPLDLQTLAEQQNHKIIQGFIYLGAKEVMKRLILLS